MTKQTPEGKLKEDVRNLLRARGAAWTEPASNQFSTRKKVDFNICYKGHFLAVETKIHPREPTSLQLEFMAEVMEAGGSTVVVYELQELEDALAKVDNGYVNTDPAVTIWRDGAIAKI